MYQLVDHPAAPFTTLAGATKGPCVHTGVSAVQGAPIYVGEQELRSILKAFRWPAPEAHAEAVAALEAARADTARLETELADAHDRLATLERAIHIRQSAAAKAKV